MSVGTYTGLVTSEHRNKEKFIATLTASLKPLVRLQETLAMFNVAFDVDTAIGAQLDVVGLWVGVSRFIRSPITGIYFAWNDSTVGWGKGIWQGEFSPTSGLTSLPDDIYRTLIRAKIAANKWDGSIPGAYDIWEEVFPNNIIVIQDKQDMTMVIGVVGEELDALTQALLTGGYIPLKPEGVGVAYYAIPVNDGPLFIWNGSGDSEGTAGWGLGSWADLIEPT